VVSSAGCDLRDLQLAQALKLAERTIQFADTLTVLTEGYLRAGRVSHASDQLEQGKKFYAAAVEGQSRNVVGAIGLAQMQMLTGMGLSFLTDGHFNTQYQMRCRLPFTLLILLYNNHSRI